MTLELPVVGLFNFCTLLQTGGVSGARQGLSHGVGAVPIGSQPLDQAFAAWSADLTAGAALFGLGHGQCGLHRARRGTAGNSHYKSAAF